MSATPCLKSLPQIIDGHDLPTTPAALLARLDALGVTYTLYEHKPVFTVTEAETIDASIPGLHCRNLFLRDKKKQNWLVVLPNDREVDMKSLPDLIGSSRLSFGSADRLWEHLGVRPGSVCPFSVVNDTDNAVKIILDRKMTEAEIVNYHPLINTMTVSMKPEGLLTFLIDTGHTPKIVDFTL